VPSIVKNDNHWITLRLIAAPRIHVTPSAQVFVTGTVRQRADVSVGKHGSSSDQRAHFGLGSSTKIDKLEIQWPNGGKQEVSIPAVDQIFTIIEGKGISEN
jgi:hypothetical protein